MKFKNTLVREDVVKNKLLKIKTIKTHSVAIIHLRPIMMYKDFGSANTDPGSDKVNRDRPIS